MDRGDGPRDGGEELKVSRIEKFLAKRQMMQTEKRKSWEKWRGFENVATGLGMAASNGNANCKGCEHNHIPGKISLYARRDAQVHVQGGPIFLAMGIPSSGEILSGM